MKNMETHINKGEFKIKWEEKKKVKNEIDGEDREMNLQSITN